MRLTVWSISRRPQSGRPHGIGPLDSAIHHEGYRNNSMAIDGSTLTRTPYGIVDSYGALEVSQEVRQRRVFRSSLTNMPPGDLPGQDDRNGASNHSAAAERGRRAHVL